MNGFGVDSAGKLYVGRCHKIEVYEYGKLINTIDSRSGRGWAMTVVDDQIIVANSTGVHTWDLNGNALKHDPDPGNMVAELSMMKETQGTDGNQYQMKSRVFGITKITKGTEIIYRIPFEDICVRTSWLLAAILLFLEAHWDKTGNSSRTENNSEP